MIPFHPTTIDGLIRRGTFDLDAVMKDDESSTEICNCAESGISNVDKIFATTKRDKNAQKTFIISLFIELIRVTTKPREQTVTADSASADRSTSKAAHRRRPIEHNRFTFPSRYATLSFPLPMLTQPGPFHA